MQLSPVGRYTEPSYPTRRILDEHPELLALVPKRWRRNPVVLAALTGVCLLLATAKSQADTKAKPSTVSRVAPIFQHGGGRGAFGCDAINPPVFLSEDEARQVVVQEASKAGIDFRSACKVVPGVPRPIPQEYERMRSKPEQYPPVRTPARRSVSVLLDGMDTKLGVGYEFVSDSDFLEWLGKDFLWASSVEERSSLKSAELLRSGIAATRVRGTYGVFYEPYTSPDYKWLYKNGKTDWEATNAQHKATAEHAKDVAREDLRKQVQDFIKWLKAQGVI